MNDFTKEELQMLKNGIQYLSDRTSLSMQYVDKCEAIERKLQSLIENYRDPNCQHEVEKELKACKLCGLPSHSIPCVGGWL